MNKSVLFFICILCITPSALAFDVYKCESQGHTQVQAHHCEESSKPSQRSFDSTVLSLGMTLEQAQKAWGKPHTTHKKADTHGEFEQWVYEVQEQNKNRKKSLSFRNGVLIAIHD